MKRNMGTALHSPETMLIFLRPAHIDANMMLGMWRQTDSNNRETNRVLSDYLILKALI